MNQYQSYDPWGERANVVTATAFRQNDSDPFRRSAQDYDRGYTGHEMLDDSGLIHMNGRLYDAELGRMLSPDPYVQVPEYSQNFNRYSYVLNNPLNKTDPTGYSWLSKAFHKIGSWVKENWRTIVSVLVAAALFVFIGPGAFGLPHLGLTGAQLGAAVGAASGAFNAAINGGSFGDVVKGAVVGGIQGGITGGALGALEPRNFGLSWEMARHVAGHGVVGGAANEAMGGKFQDGFLSAAASSFAGDMGWNEGATPLSRTIKAGIIGGTASNLGGGKFANGAWSAAFQHLLNHEAHREARAAWTKEQAIAELSNDGIELNWFEKLMFSNEAIGNGMEHIANTSGGVGDGVSMGAASKLSAAIYGDEAVWADTNSGMYKAGYWTGVAGTAIPCGGNALVVGGEQLASRGAFHLGKHVARDTIVRTFGGKVAQWVGKRPYSELWTRSMFNSANRTWNSGQGLGKLLTTVKYNSPNGGTVVRNIFTNKIVHYNPFW